MFAIFSNNSELAWMAFGVTLAALVLNLMFNRGNRRAILKNYLFFFAFCGLFYLVDLIAFSR